MVSRVILTCTACLLVALGVLLDFLPQETAAALGLAGASAATLLLQLLAAAMLGLGFLNWFSKANPMGGIYSRPLALCNFLFFGVSAIPLDRALIRVRLPSAISATAVVSTVLALAYAWLLFFHDPIRSPSKTS